MVACVVKVSRVCRAVVVVSRLGLLASFNVQLLLVTALERQDESVGLGDPEKSNYSITGASAPKVFDLP